MSIPDKLAAIAEAQKAIYASGYLEGLDQSGAVLYVEQDLTEKQKEQARENIGAGSAKDVEDNFLAIERINEDVLEHRVVRTDIFQDLTEEQKEQARKNIGSVDPEAFRLVSEETNENWRDIQRIFVDMSEMVSTNTQHFDEKQKAQARQNIGAAVVEDASVGVDMWSSKNTVDKLCPAFTESGAVVTCNPVAGYPLQVATQLPADGCSGLTLRHFGENLLKPTLATNKTVTGVTFTVNGDGSITANGTATDQIFYDIGKAQLVKGKKFTVVGCPEGGTTSTSFNIYFANNSEPYYETGNGLELTAKATQNNTFRILIQKGCTLTDAVFRPAVYETNEGKTYSVNFGTTINGGIYDWNRGVLEYGSDEDYSEMYFDGQTINALDGVNTLWVDVGTNTVTGKADPVAVIEKLTNAILALGGNV